MMMSFNHHRKIPNLTAEVEESGFDLPKFCQPFCNAELNPTGVCAPLCINLCDDVCKKPPPVPEEAPPPIIVKQLIPHPKSFNLHHLLVIVLAVLVAGLFFLTCYAIYKLYMKWVRSRLRRRSLPTRRVLPEEPEPDDELDEDVYGPVLDHPIWYIRTIGLQPSVISAILIVGYKKGDGLIEGTDCSICLTEFEEDENVRLLPKCNHAFHVPCIDTWLRSHTNCPLCRAPIVSNSSSVVSVPSRELVAVRNNPSGGGLGETREGGLNSGGEIRRDLLENDDGTTEVASNDLGIREGNNSSGGGLELDGTITPQLRRSISFDSLSASRISAVMTKALQGKSDGNLDTNRLVKDTESSSIVKNGVGSNHNLSILVQCPSMERSMQRDQSCSSSVKRSVSCSAKVFLSRYGSRNQNSGNSR